MNYAPPACFEYFYKVSCEPTGPWVVACPPPFEVRIYAERPDEAREKVSTAIPSPVLDNEGKLLWKWNLTILKIEEIPFQGIVEVEEP